ncbi:MAG: PKD domain-containing protein [Bacteroidetes bacterium]|nr:PKD domain-containing protein [Bacteroidota bacterium]
MPFNLLFPTTSGPYTWNWDFGDGQTSNQFNPLHIYTTNGNFPIHLEATSVNGCKLGYSLNGSVKVFSPEALFTPDVTSGCAPLLVNFNNQSINAALAMAIW